MQVIDVDGKEIKRAYFYKSHTIEINNPKKIWISERGSHRVLDGSGWITYVPNGWNCLKWLPTSLDEPVVA